eukprot:symbB.v1.2.001425.t1/scaffold34.1/size402451/6
MPDAPEDLVSSWLDFVTQNNEYKEILTREELWILIRVCYKVVNSTVLTTDVSVMESTSLATLEVGEVLELIGDETLEATEELDLHRIRARRLKDGQEGWVTVRGNAQSVFLQLGGDRLAVVKETSLTESVSISGQDVLRPLRVGELLDIMGEESMDEVSGLRARVRAQSDGQVGWATKVGTYASGAKGATGRREVDSRRGFGDRLPMPYAVGGFLAEALNLPQSLEKVAGCSSACPLKGCSLEVYQE